jgi:hypothetical protein
VLLSSDKPVLKSEEKIQNHYLAKDPDLVFGTVSSDGIHETTASLDEEHGGNWFRLLNDQFVTLCEPGPDPLFIGIHEACLQIAKRVMRTRATYSCTDLPGRRVDSMRTLWDVLESRYKATTGSTGFYAPAMLLDSPHDYHMEEGRLTWWRETRDSECFQEPEV